MTHFRSLKKLRRSALALASAIAAPAARALDATAQGGLDWLSLAARECGPATVRASAGLVQTRQ